MVLSIELEDNIWAFDPGQTINGKVIIDKQIWSKVEGLTIRFYGKLEVGTSLNVPRPPAPLPTSSQGRSLSLVSVNASRYSGCVASAKKLIQRQKQVEEIFLDQTISLLDSWKVLKPGRHAFEFSFTLPNDGILPPSLKIDGAQIHYEFVTSLKRPRDDFKVYQTPFYVNSSSDQYSEDNLQLEHYFNPAVFKAERSLSQLFGCCMTAKICMEVKLERTVFPVGGEITFVASVQNELRSHLDEMSVKLIRKFKTKKTPTCSTKEVIFEGHGPKVESGESQVWSSSLQIPNVTNTLLLETFELNYVLQFLVRPINHPAKDLTLKFSLMILPLTAFNSLLIQHSSRVGIEENYPEGVPPPTYYEATNVSFSADEQSTSHLLPIEIG